MDVSAHDHVSRLEPWAREAARVVVAQGDADELSLTLHRLAPAPVRTVGVTTLRDALEALASPCAAFVSDSHLGDDCVFDVLGERIVVPLPSEVPFIGLTGHALACERQVSARMGMRRLLTKPLAAGTLTLVLEDLLYASARVPPASPRSRSGTAPEYVLVVDDEPALLGMVRMMLEGHGFEAILAGGGKEALAKLTMGPLPSVILTDGNMPSLSGAALVDILRADPRFRHIPIIGMSGGDYPFPPGVVPLAKPFSWSSLCGVLQASLAPRRG